MQDDERPFLIDVKRPWTLLILPILAGIYFLFIFYLGITRSEVRGVPTDYLVLGGLAFFIVVALLQLPFLFRRKGPRSQAAPAPAGGDAWQPGPTESAPLAGSADDERVATSETQQGLRVLEYSVPAKSRNRGSVYAKTYVPVTKEHVLRVETLAAMPHEI